MTRQQILYTDLPESAEVLIKRNTLSFTSFLLRDKGALSRAISIPKRL